jgi:hypothetical protein
MKFKTPTPKQALLSLAALALMFIGGIVDDERVRDDTREIVREELEKIKEEKNGNKN